MKINVVFPNQRLLIDVTSLHTVLDVKGKIKAIVKHDSDAISPTNITQKSEFILMYNRTPLNNNIIISDIGLVSGSTLKCRYVETPKYNLQIFVTYSSEVLQLRDEIDIKTLTIGQLRHSLQNKLGIPVSMFHIIQPQNNRELFDEHTMDYYNITEGDTLNLEVWDDTRILLVAAFQCDISQTLNNIPSYYDNPCLNRYLLKVVLFIAAHMDYTKLAAQLLQRGVR